MIQSRQIPYPETLNIDSEKMSEKTPGRILSVLADHPEATIADLAAFLNVSGRTIERNLKRLRDQGCIRRIGPDRSGYWEVVSGGGINSKKRNDDAKDAKMMQ